MINKLSKKEKKELNEVAHYYDFRITNIKKVHTATICNVYKITTVKNFTYGIKIYPSVYSHKDISSEVNFVNYLKSHSLPVMSYIESIYGSYYISLKNNKKVAVHSWFEGAFTYLNFEILDNILYILKVLVASSSNFNEVRCSKWMWEDFNRYLDIVNLPNGLKSRINWFKYTDQPWSSKDNLIMCHNDLSSQNILSNSNNDLMIIDFTNSINAPIEWEYSIMIANFLLEGFFIKELDKLIKKIEYNSDINIELFIKYLEFSLIHRLVSKLMSNESNELVIDNFKSVYFDIIK